jgi:hypothetical protein
VTSIVITLAVSMLIVLGIVAGVLGLVLVGINGRGKHRAPRLAHTFARAAQHLNGDGEAPQVWLDGFERASRRAASGGS